MSGSTSAKRVPGTASACVSGQRTGALKTWLAFGATPDLAKNAASVTVRIISPCSGAASCERLSGPHGSGKGVHRGSEIRRRPGLTCKVRGAYADSLPIRRRVKRLRCPVAVDDRPKSGTGPDGLRKRSAHFNRRVLTGALSLLGESLAVECHQRVDAAEGR